MDITHEEFSNGAGLTVLFFIVLVLVATITKCTVVESIKNDCDHFGQTTLYELMDTREVYDCALEENDNG